MSSEHGLLQVFPSDVCPGLVQDSRHLSAHGPPAGLGKSVLTLSPTQQGTLPSGQWMKAQV